MNTPWGRLDEQSTEGHALGWFARYYHVLALVGLTVFTFWYRARNWRNFVDGGTVYFRGNDPYYHLRSVEYVVHNWPRTQQFDPWTYFPNGTATAQFGTLMDQIVATVALILGLGNPSDQLIRLVVLFAPVAFGLLAIVPTYYIGRRLGGRFAGVVSVAILALAGGGLIQYSVVGFYDHHVFEAVLQATAVLGLMVAISAAEREKPIWELIRDREVRVLRKSLGWAILAGVVMGIYLWVWPPGLYFFGIVGVFFAVHLSAEYLRGRSPEHTAIVGAVALTVAGILFLSTLKSFELAGTDRTILQPLAAFVVAGGCVFMAWLARFVDDTDFHRAAYPAAIAGTAVVVIGAVALLAPTVYSFFVDEVTRVFGFWTPATGATATVGEAQPLGDVRLLFEDYYLASIGAIGGGAVILGRQVLDDEPSGAELFVLVWAVFSLASVLTQQRFSYYLTIPVAGLNAALVGFVMRYVRTEDAEFGIETYELFTVLTIVALLLAPLLVPTPVAMDNADGQTHPQNVIGPAGWDSSLDWMDENTPEPGQFGDPDAEGMDYYGSFERTDDFAYPDGAYGVLSWWDYGHWITSEAHRIPVANPFQQGASEAATFLLAQDEDEAEEVIATEFADGGAEARYVMVDWQMVETAGEIGGKYFAPPAFVDDVQQDDFYEGIVDPELLQQTDSLQAASPVKRHKQGYYDSMAVRLYHYHGSAADPEPATLQWTERELETASGERVTYPFVPVEGEDGVFRAFDSMEEAESFVENRSNAQIGGIGAIPEQPVDALEQYRLVHTSSDFAFSVGYQGTQLTSPWTTGFQRTIQGADLLQELSTLQRYQDLDQPQMQQAALDFLHDTSPMWTKTFERVPGATIEGEAPANATLTASVEMAPPHGDNFTYRQNVETDGDGSFTATVPYSTSGYDEWGPEQGYTNTSVRATGSYTLALPPEQNDDGQFVQRVAEVDVTEAQVIGQDEAAVQVDAEDFEEQVIFDPQEATTPEDDPDGEQTNSEQPNGEEANGEEPNGEEANGEEPNSEETNGEQTNGEDDSTDAGANETAGSVGRSAAVAGPGQP